MTVPQVQFRLSRQGSASPPADRPFEVVQPVDRATAKKQVCLPRDPVRAGSWLAKFVPCALLLVPILASCAAFYGGLTTIGHNRHSVVPCAAPLSGAPGTQRPSPCEQVH
jgi:hypothetical protein